MATGREDGACCHCFCFSAFDIVKAVQLLLWQAITFLFLFLSSLFRSMIFSLPLTSGVFAPLVLRFSSRVFSFRFSFFFFGHLPTRLAYGILVLRTTNPLLVACWLLFGMLASNRYAVGCCALSNTSTSSELALFFFWSPCICCLWFYPRHVSHVNFL